MLYLLHHLARLFTPLNVFQYVTFRAAGAGATAFLLVALLGGPTARWLRKLRAVAEPRLLKYAPDEVEEGKKRTPSMGGLLIVAALILAVVLWAVPTNGLVHVFLFLLTALAAVGFADDYLKIRNGSSADALSSGQKLALQLGIAMLAVWWLDAVAPPGHLRQLMVPFYKAPLIENLPLWAALLFGTLVVVASSNAVNLTDGMDGLASGCTVICAATYGVFAYICGHAVFADYLHVPQVAGASEVMVIVAAMGGAVLGFLWHNCHPAKMFMGDTGSLSLGGGIGLIAVLVRQELVLIIVGGVFVIEALSVILQVGYFKYTRIRTGEGKRIFRRSPIHDHFKLGGWTETQVVVRFWILALILAGLGLATLKIR